MEKQISIIIPTYNMEAYIGKCLDSLIIPEFDAVEVLVVNDGSKDRSSEIAHSYADRYPASIRVIDKPNGNYGSCINAALPLATGRYVKILDADDTFDTDAFSRLLRLLPNISADVILSSFCTTNEDGQDIGKYGVGDYNAPKDTQIDISVSKMDIFSRYVPMHRITYKREIFLRFNYHQIEGVSYSDAQWSMQPLSVCDSAYITDIYVYRYLIGRVGQTVDPSVAAKSIPQSFRVLGRLVDDIAIFPRETHNHDFYRAQVVRGHRSLYLSAINHATDSIMQILKNHDLKLKEIDSSLYDSVGNLGYENFENFKFIKLLRKKDYPLNFKIPPYTRTFMALKNIKRRIKSFI